MPNVSIYDLVGSLGRQPTPHPRRFPRPVAAVSVVRVPPPAIVAPAPSVVAVVAVVKRRGRGRPKGRRQTVRVVERMDFPQCVSCRLQMKQHGLLHRRWECSRCGVKA